MVTPIACGLDLATCTASEGCYPTATGAFCLEAGTVPEDDPCVSQNDCEAGFGCIDRQVGPDGAFCTELCDTANGFNCSTGGPCTPIAGTPSGFGACDYDPCDPLDVSTCGPGLACFPTSAGDLCLDEGPTPAGGSCTIHTDCVAGTWCVGDPGSEICMVLCDPANGDADCTLGEACTPLTSDPAIGACAPGCGNGVPNAGEACDDGANNGTGDGFCLSDCSGVQTCGDSTANGTETCDDGANNGTGEGFCLSDCSATQTCGDTIENGTEECDEGPADTMACNADCTDAACGDGYLNAAAGEVCDDGNTDDGDGCNSTCMPQAACGLDQAACLPTEACYPTASAAGAYCYTAGTGVEDDPCINQFDCAPGLGCIDRQFGPPGSFCTELCDPANGFNCADGGPCNGIGSPSGIGACDPDACDPLDVSTCNGGLACYPTTSGDLCLDAGTTPVGASCAIHTDCVAGSWCVNPGSGDICMDLCDPANGNADCTVGQSCFPLTSNPAIGVCF
jgi:cysteine-rich repeat protein